MPEATPTVGRRKSIEADLWNRLWKNSHFASWDTLSQDVYDVLLSEIGDIRGKRILEAGSGSGRVSMRLAQDGARVTLLDFSEEALIASQQRFAAEGLVGEFVEGPIEKMPLPDATFDVVFNTGVLEHYTREEQLAQLREMKRILRPGGLLIVLVPYAGAALYRVSKWFQERSGTWQFDYEDPLQEIAPLLQEVGLLNGREYTAAFNTLCEIGRAFPGGNAFSAYQAFWYHQLSQEERKLVPGYLLVGVARKAGGPAVEVTQTPSTLPLPKQGEIVVLSSVNWDYLWQRPQQLAVQFSALGHRTVFVNGTAMEMTLQPDITPEQFSAHLSDMMVRSTRWSGEIAVAWPITTISMATQKEDITEVWLDRLLQLLNVKNPIFWTVSWEWGQHVDTLKKYGLVVYDCVDELSGFSWATPAMLEKERQLLEGADIVTVSAQNLQRVRMQQREQVYLLPNGVNPEQFVASNGPRNDRPVIGFLGAVANWLDTELVAKVAQANPDWTILVVGSHEGGDLTPIRSIPNVVLTGKVEYSRVPAVLSRFDVGIIPFKINELTHNANPIKVYEYMAAGLPVVATPFAENAFFGDWVAVASTAEEFSAAIRTALDSRTPERDEERRVFVRKHSWRSRSQLGLGIAMAYDAARRGDLVGAEEVLRTGLQLASDDEQSTLELQSAAADLGLARVVTESLAHDVERTSALVETLLERHAFQAALALAQQVALEHPENPDALFNCATLQMMAGQPVAALPHFLRLAEKGDASAYASVAEALVQVGKADLADHWILLSKAAEEGGSPSPAELRALIAAAKA